MNRRQLLVGAGALVGAGLVPTVALPALELVPVRKAPEDVLTRIMRMAKCMDAAGVPDSRRSLYVTPQDRDALWRVFDRKAVWPTGFQFPERYRTYTGFMGQVERFHVYCDRELKPGYMFGMHASPGILRTMYLYD